jgi:MHS family proline/betaine transporter-like MFS transporter
MGLLSDRVGRKPVMLVSALGYVILGFPMFLLPVMLRSAAGLMIAQSVSGLLLAMYAGPICAILSELFPTRVRYTALSVGYGFAVTIFGGFAPFIATFLIRVTGSQVSPAAYVVFGAAISAVSLILIKDPTNAPLD